MICSLSFGTQKSKTIDNAVGQLLDAGLPVVVAAGNERVSACFESPSAASDVIATGSTDRTDQISSFSNYGRCVAIYAPGENVAGARRTGVLVPQTSCITQRSGLSSVSGTSFSSPLVAGAISVYQSSGQMRRQVGGKTGRAYTKAVKQYVQDQGTQDVVQPNGIFTFFSSRNALLLFV